MIDRWITGRQAWRAGEISEQDWRVPIDAAALAELEALARTVDDTDPERELRATPPVPMPACKALMQAVRARLDAAGGLAVLDRIPVERHDLVQNRHIAWTLARLMGQVVDQKWTGTRLYDVKDLGKPLGYGVRRSITNLEQPFHTDGGWLRETPQYVGLFCLDTAAAGGVSRFASLVNAHNVLRERRPDLLARLYRPFAWDRQAEHDPAHEKVALHPVFEDRDGVLEVRWYEDYVRKGHVMARTPLDPEGDEALAALAAIVDDPAHWIEFRIERGQFQYLNNRQFAHCRTGFADGGDARHVRHLLRIWNRDRGTPTVEGGPA